VGLKGGGRNWGERDRDRGGGGERERGGGWGLGCVLYSVNMSCVMHIQFNTIF